MDGMNEVDVRERPLAIPYDPRYLRYRRMQYPRMSSSVRRFASRVACGIFANLHIR